uniref:Uncharacterized protein n=1 Tax=viral metagenome TaxID=1070528 RepID=A0A6M3LF14_9ZZZZ
MTNRLPELERAYFIRKLGGTQGPTKPLNQIKREYWSSFVGEGAANTPFNELELRWILRVLGDAGITPANSNSEADLWKQMVLSITEVPVNYINQNKITFYINAS